MFIGILFTSYSCAQSFEWVKQIGGNYCDHGNSVTIDSDGNIYTTGNFRGNVDFDPGLGITNLVSEGLNDIFIQKLSPTGNLLWVRQIGGVYVDSGTSISNDLYGNVYTIGTFRDTVDFDPGIGITNLASKGLNDIFIQKLDTDGNLIWVKQMGGMYDDNGTSITIDTEGNIYTIGNFRDTVDFDTGTGITNLISFGDRDVFIQKLDANGNFLWAKQLGGMYDDNGTSVTTDTEGNIYSTGYFKYTVDFDPGPGTVNLTSPGGKDIFIQKLDTNGNFLWAKQMGGMYSDIGNSIINDLNGNIYTIGAFRGTVDFDPGTEIINLTSIDNWDIFIQKLNSDGNFLWVKQMGGVADDFGTSITTDNLGNVYTIGNFCDTVDFDPGIGISNLASNGDKDIFIQKLDSDGNFLWIKQMGGLSTERSSFITSDNFGNVYTTGTFSFLSNAVDFDPGIGINNLISEGCRDIFIQKLSRCVVGVSHDFVSTCDSSFTWIDGNTYTESTTTNYTINGGASNRCDSLIVLHLSIGVSDITTNTNEMTITANNSNASYQWLDCDNNYSPIIGATNQHFIASQEGNYAVELTENGCVDTSACVYVGSVGFIENSFADQFVINPNPSNGNFSISFESIQEDLIIRLLSVSGQLVEQKSYQNSQFIELEIEQPNGVYLLEILEGDQNRAVIKLVKE